MEQLKRANKLWTNDSLHVRRSLVVPLPLEPSDAPAACGSSDSDEPADGGGGDGGDAACGAPERGQLPSADDFLRHVDSVIASSRRNVSRLRVD